MLEIFKETLLKSIFEDAVETLNEGGTYVAQCDDGMLVIDNNEETLSVNFIMGEPVRYVGTLLDVKS